jgi:hypothetical protein
MKKLALVVSALMMFGFGVGACGGGSNSSDNGKESGDGNLKKVYDEIRAKHHCDEEKTYTENEDSDECNYEGSNVCTFLFSNYENIAKNNEYNFTEVASCYKDTLDKCIEDVCKQQDIDVMETLNEKCYKTSNDCICKVLKEKKVTFLPITCD